MADFFLWIRLSRLPHSYVKREVVEGMEQNVLCLPIKESQLFMDKSGDICVKGIMEELPQVDSGGATHRFKLMYRNAAESKKARIAGYEHATKFLGTAIPWKQDMERTHQFPNDKATDISIRGAICLDDITDEDMVVKTTTAQKFVPCTFKSVGPKGTPILLVGMIDMDSIVDNDIVLNPRTGKRNIPCTIKKMEETDFNRNTHILVVTKKDGSEIEIGRFREYKEATKTQARIAAIQEELAPQEHEQTEEQPIKPLQIDGYNF